jgi:hypothetical protein
MQWPAVLPLLLQLAALLEYALSLFQKLYHLLFDWLSYPVLAVSVDGALPKAG